MSAAQVAPSLTVSAAAARRGVILEYMKAHRLGLLPQLQEAAKEIEDPSTKAVAHEPLFAGLYGGFERERRKLIGMCLAKKMLKLRGNKMDDDAEGNHKKEEEKDEAPGVVTNDDERSRVEMANRVALQESARRIFSYIPVDATKVRATFEEGAFSKEGLSSASSSDLAGKFSTSGVGAVVKDNNNSTVTPITSTKKRPRDADPDTGMNDYGLGGEGANAQPLPASAQKAVAPGAATTPVLKSATTGETGEGGGDYSTCTPSFFLFPPFKEAKLFVRVLVSPKTTTELGGEEMNRFFARYGFIGCTSLTHMTTSNPAGALAFPEYGTAAGIPRYQDFIVELDSLENVESALEENASVEIIFMAYHSSNSNNSNTNSANTIRNKYFPSDIPSLAETIEFCYSGLQLPPPIGATTIQIGDNGMPSAQPLMTPLIGGRLPTAILSRENTTMMSRDDSNIWSPLMKKQQSTLFGSGGGAELAAQVSTLLGAASTPTGGGGGGLHPLAPTLPNALAFDGQGMSEVIKYRSALDKRARMSGEVDPLEELQAGKDGERFLPEIIIDGIPWWTLTEQIASYCAGYGDVVKIRMATSDRCGVFLGCCAVTMSSYIEAERLSTGLTGKEIDGAVVVAGVCDEDLNLVSLKDPKKILKKRKGELKVSVPDGSGVVSLDPSAAAAEEKEKNSGILPLTKANKDKNKATSSLDVGKYDPGIVWQPRLAL